jgi:hypothetical protein
MSLYKLVSATFDIEKIQEHATLMRWSTVLTVPFSKRSLHVYKEDPLIMPDPYMSKEYLKHWTDSLTSSPLSGTVDGR